jgi:competence protein ComEC
MAAAPALLAAVAVLGGVILAMPWPLRLRALGLPLVLPVLLWQTPRPEQGQFELLAPDIGQGNAVLVRTARHTLIYDTGPRYSQESDAGHRVLVPLLRSLGEEVQRVVLSHSDTDHSGGAQAVLQMQGKADLVSSIANDHPLQGQRTATRCLSGSSWEWDGVRFSFLHPSDLDYHAVRKSNAMSCVLRLDNGRQRALLVGDIEKAQELALSAEPDQLRADVLLVPHHGSKTSSSASFLDAVQPRVALLQAGYRNRFGHPAASVMQRYRERGIAVADSPHCGAALWRSTSPEMVQCERELEMHYWQHRVLPAIALTESP